MSKQVAIEQDGKVIETLPGDVAKKDVTILELDLEHRVGKSLDNFSVLFYRYLFGH